MRCQRHRCLRPKLEPGNIFDLDSCVAAAQVPGTRQPWLHPISEKVLSRHILKVFYKCYSFFLNVEKSTSLNLASILLSKLRHFWWIVEERKKYLKLENILISTKFIFLTLLRQAIKACGHKTRETIKDPLKPYKKFRVLQKICCSTFYLETCVQKLIKSQLFKFCVLKIVFSFPGFQMCHSWESQSIFSKNSPRFSPAV